MPDDSQLDSDVFDWPTPQELRVIAEQIKRGETPPKITVRQLLRYFGFHRRGLLKVVIVREALAALGISTDPDFTEVWIDSEIELVSKKPEDRSPGTAILLLSTGRDTDAEKANAGIAVLGEDPVATVVTESSDPTHRIGLLAAANQAVVSVKPDDYVTTAVSRMLYNDFSQLPVMQNSRDVKGIVSWSSIGSRMALKQACEKVRDSMDTRVMIVETSASIFTVIPLIVEHSYVLVKAPDNTISGIVTASDLSLEFQKLSGPFLLLREIEQHIRQLIQGKLSLTELQSIRDPVDDREIKNANDLTLGEYVRIFQAPPLWEKLGLDGLSRNEFPSTLDQIRLIRNEIMHFDPDPLDPIDLAKLTSFARFLQKLQDIRTA